MKYILAYYLFTELEDPHLEVRRHLKFFKDRDVSARIYLSKEGINGQMSAGNEDAETYMSWLRQDPRFEKIEFKIHRSQEHVFPKVTVKYRKQLVALDQRVDMHAKGEYLSPTQWCEMLEKRDENTVVLDVRNQYEWEVGHFEGAIPAGKDTFREFPQLAEKLTKDRDPKQTQVMMYCTGGIRCELYSSLLKEKGFETIYQLQGGVIKYGLEEGNKHWEGKLFVFDDRLVIPISDDEHEIISHCQFCNKSSDTYYNCANMDCNELFISCRDCCIETWKGCCRESCQSGRVRPLETHSKPKPFRKLPFKVKQKINELNLCDR